MTHDIGCSLRGYRSLMRFISACGLQCDVNPYAENTLFVPTLFVTNPFIFFSFFSEQTLIQNIGAKIGQALFDQT